MLSDVNRSWQKAFNVKLQIFLMVDLLSIESRRSSSKVSTSCFVIHFRRNFSASAIISSLNASMPDAYSKWQHQLLSWQLYFLYLLCWLYHIQWGHGLLVELQQSPNLNHWRDHEWGRMFWNFLDRKQTITLTNQSTWHFSSICHEIDNHVSMVICWQQMRWNSSVQFRLNWLSDQTSFCKIKTCSWDFITHENFTIEISQARIVNMT